MNYEYYNTKAEFDRAHEKMHTEYIAAGMSEEAWQELYKFDLEQFNCDRKEMRHTVPLETENEGFDDDDDSINPLLKDNIDFLSVSIDDEPSIDEFWWLEELDNPEIAKKCKDLSFEEKKLLTMRYSKIMTEEDIAKLLGTYQKNVSRMIAKIIKKIK